MKIIKKTFIFFIVIFTLVILISCAKKTEVTDNVMVESEDETFDTTEIIVDNKKEAVVETEEETSESKNMTGKYMFIMLKTNPTTGFDYVWSIKDGSDTYINLEDTYTTKTTDIQMMGAPIYRTYVFNADGCEEGKLTIDFDYMRNWPGGENAYHIYYDLKVNSDNTITFIDKKVKKEAYDVDIKDYDDPTFADIYNVEKEEYEEEPEN